MTGTSLRGSVEKAALMLMAVRRAGDDTLIVGRGGAEPAMAAFQTIGMENKFTVIEDYEMGPATFVWTTAAALGELTVPDEALDLAEADGD